MQTTLVAVNSQMNSLAGASWDGFLVDDVEVPALRRPPPLRASLTRSPWQSFALMTETPGASYANTVLVRRRLQAAPRG